LQTNQSMNVSISEIIKVLQRWRATLPNHPMIRKGAWLLIRLLSSLGGRAYRNEFAEIQQFCLFVGHPRSGHTLLGALLDAHPNMVIAHELHSLRYVSEGVTREELCYLLLSRARWFARRGAETNQHIEKTGYKYAVPSQHQGTCSTLRVIGDKRGGGTSSFLLEHPYLLSRLQCLVEIPVKVVHVTRHPLDNISTLARKHYDSNVDAAIGQYFRLFEGVQQAEMHTPDGDWKTLAHEDLILSSENTLREVCSFLGVESPEDYLRDCSEIVFDRPSHSRDKVAYTPDQLARIRQEASLSPFLNRYDFPARKRA